MSQAKVDAYKNAKANRKETMKKDKKMIGGQNRLILLKKLGSAYIDETVTDEEILDALRFSRYEE